MIDKIISHMKEHIPNHKVIIGISGGKDSTVVAALSVRAFGRDNVMGVMMPNEVQSDINDSIRVCELLQIPNITINIGDTYQSLTKELSNHYIINRNYETNTPARLRMTTLYGLSAILGGRVLNTCNRSEDVMGYSTLFGDSAGSYSPLMDFTVTEVKSIGKELGLPDDLINKTPSDGMCGSSDEENLSRLLGIDNFTYARLDKLIRDQDYDFSKDEISKIIDRYKKYKFKLELIQLPHPSSGLYDYFKEIKNE